MSGGFDDRGLQRILLRLFGTVQQVQQTQKITDGPGLLLHDDGTMALDMDQAEPGMTLCVGSDGKPKWALAAEGGGGIQIPASASPGDVPRVNASETGFDYAPALEIPLSNRGDLLTRNGDGLNAPLGKGAAGSVLVSDDTEGLGLKWSDHLATKAALGLDGQVAPSMVPRMDASGTGFDYAPSVGSYLTGKGDLLVGAGAGAVEALAMDASTDTGKVLTVGSNGPEWTTPVAGISVDGSAPIGYAPRVNGDRTGFVYVPAPEALLAQKGDLLTRNGNDQDARLGKGVDGSVLVSDDAEGLGLKWSTPDLVSKAALGLHGQVAPSMVPRKNASGTGFDYAPSVGSYLSGKGDLLVGAGAGAVEALATNASTDTGKVLTVGLDGPEWSTPEAGVSIGDNPPIGYAPRVNGDRTGFVYVPAPEALLAQKGDLLTRNGSGQDARLGKGVDGSVLVSDDAEGLGLKWSTPDLVSKAALGLHGQVAPAMVPRKNASGTGFDYAPSVGSYLSGKGDLLVGAGAGAVEALATNASTDTGKVLTVGSNGPEWSTPSGYALPLSKAGDLVVHNGSDIVQLKRGLVNGSVLRCTAGGLEWSTEPLSQLTSISLGAPNKAPRVNGDGTAFIYVDPPETFLQTEGDLVVGTGVPANPMRGLPKGSPGTLLVAGANGPEWSTQTLTDLTSGGGLEPTAKGQLVTHDGTAAILHPMGTEGQVLTADSNAAAGLKWSMPAPGVDTLFSAKGDLLTRDVNGTVQPLSTGGVPDGWALTRNSGEDLGLAWAPVGPVPGQKGELATYSTSGSGAAVLLGAGTDGQVLTVNAAMDTGLEWKAPFAIAAPIAKGQIGTYGDAGPVLLEPSIVNGAMLITDVNSASGLAWSTDTLEGLQASRVITGGHPNAPKSMKYIKADEVKIRDKATHPAVVPTIPDTWNDAWRFAVSDPSSSPWQHGIHYGHLFDDTVRASKFSILSPHTEIPASNRSVSITIELDVRFFTKSTNNLENMALFSVSDTADLPGYDGGVPPTQLPWTGPDTYPSDGSSSAAGKRVGDASIGLRVNPADGLHVLQTTSAWGGSNGSFSVESGVIRYEYADLTPAEMQALQSPTFFLSILLSRLDDTTSGDADIFDVQSYKATIHSYLYEPTRITRTLTLSDIDDEPKATTAHPGSFDNGDPATGSMRGVLDPTYDLAWPAADPNVRRWTSWASAGNPQMFNVALLNATVVVGIRYVPAYDTPSSPGAFQHRNIKDFEVYGSNTATDFDNVDPDDVQGTMTRLYAGRMQIYNANDLYGLYGNGTYLPTIMFRNTEAYKYYCFRFLTGYTSSQNFEIRRLEFIGI